jgi:hypothetical protein
MRSFKCAKNLPYCEIAELEPSTNNPKHTKWGRSAVIAVLAAALLTTGCASQGNWLRVSGWRR